MTTISAIVPTFNRARLLREALASILAQERPADEIIVVDDGSTDGTREVVERLRPRFRYVFQPNRGAASARNLGGRVATGQHLAFLDSDDVWLPAHLGTLLGHLRSLPDPAGSVAISLARLTDLDGAVMPGERLAVAVPQLGAMLIPRPVWDLVGPLAETLRFGEDVEWILRARERGVRFELVSQVTLLYRHHDGNVTRDRTATLRGVARALHASLARRRANGGALAPVHEADRPEGRGARIVPDAVRERRRGDSGA
jgi:glycosyltransferase involved in cell wall biosynthesis